MLKKRKRPVRSKRKLRSLSSGIKRESGKRIPSRLKASKSARSGKPGKRRKKRLAPGVRLRRKRLIKRKSPARRLRKRRIGLTGSAAYHQGFNQAYNQGYNAGFAKGFEDGHQIAYEEQP